MPTGNGIARGGIDGPQAGLPYCSPDHQALVRGRRRGLRATADEFGFGGQWCLVYDGGKRHFGLGQEQLAVRAAEAELLVAISGSGLPRDSPLLRIPHRAYVDVDPGYTQLWAQQVDMHLDQFDSFFTVGLNVGAPGSAIPTGGIQWNVMLPPVVLDLWPANIDPECERFSTVGDWWANQYVRFEGQDYGPKSEQFLRFIGVPLEAGQPVEAALSIYPRDHREIGLLQRNGWILRDPFMYAGDPAAYREFIRYSRAEFSVAKGGYVRLGTGWVSDRSACYLASGKPVLVQSTGIERHLPVGDGLLTFRTPQEAVAGLHAINADYLDHARAAREIAEGWFDSDLVLSGLLARAWERRTSTTPGQA